MTVTNDLNPAEQRVGQVIRGKYRIDRVLGDGGMATVFAATHRNQKQFAIKILHPELSHQPEIRTRFLREGYAANSVKHPGAVAVLDDDVTDDGAAFLVMELLEGKTVEKLAEASGGRLPASSVLAIAHQLLDVLASAHAQGIVHRDIKPANIFVTGDGQVKVLDFGIARVRDAASGGSHATGTGLLLGTPAFMSPEQALGKSSEVGPATDLWAVGATLFTLLTGRPVHQGETGQHMVILSATTQAQSLGAYDPQMPAPIVSVVDHALAYQIAHRWPSAEAMRDAVRDASLAVFGRVPQRDAVMLLFGNRADPLASTRAVGATSGYVPGSSAPPTGPQPPPPHTPQPGRLTPAPVPVTVPMAAMPVPPTATLGSPREAPVPVGRTTSQPVSNDAPYSRPAGVPRARGPVLAFVALAGILGVGGGALFALRSMRAAAEPAPAPSATDVPSGPQVTEGAGHPAASASGASTAPSATAAPTTATASTATPAPASATATAIAASAHPVHAVPTAAPSATGGTSAGSASAAPVCKLVSFFDSDGNKHFRQECH